MLGAERYLADFIRANVPDFNSERVLVCATNGGGMKFTRTVASELCVSFLICDRFREKAGGVARIKIISDLRTPDDVEAIIVVDDMFDTCNSLTEVCAALNGFAPKAKLYGVATHGYFSGDAHLEIKRLVENFG